MSTAKAAISSIKPFSSIPGPLSLPLVGSCLRYRFGSRGKTEYHLALKDMHQEFGPLVKEQIGTRTILHVFCPDDIKTVYSVEGKWPVIPPLQETTAMYREQKEMSLGLGNTNGEEWYKLRSNSQQRMLRPKEVAHHLPSVNRIANELVDRLDTLAQKDHNREIDDLRLEVGRWSLENAANLVFDRRMGCLEDGDTWGKKLVEANATIFRLSGDLKLSLPLYKVISTPKWKDLVSAEDQFYSEAIALCDEAILEFRSVLENGSMNSKQFYFLSCLLSREALSLKDVTVICLSLFSDGLSTTTPTLLFNLYCLATLPEVQEKVFQEIEREIPADEPITTSSLANLPYLKAFVKETFRLWPNGTEVSRYCEQDLVLSGYQVPAGTHLDLNPSVHFMNSQLFPEPENHQPERLRSYNTTKFKTFFY